MYPIKNLENFTSKAAREMLRSLVRTQVPARHRVIPAGRFSSRPVLGAISGVRYNSTKEIKTEIGSVSTNTPPPTPTGSGSSSAVETVNEVAQNISPDQIGYFQSLGLAQNWWWPPDIFQHIFEYTHVYTGLPWWGTIAVVTVGMRLVMFPLYFKASDTTARFSKLQPEMQKILEDYQKSKDPMDGQKALLRRKKLMAEHNVKYRWLMAPMFSAPFFIGIFAGLNRMCAAQVADLAHEGLLWFSNLSATDPYLGLQVITAGIYSSTFKLGGEMGATASPAASTMRKILPWMPLIAIPLTMKIPAATCFYFALNGLLSLIQAAAFRSPTFRKLTGMSPLAQNVPDPNKNLNTVDSVKKMFSNIKEKAEENAQKTREERLREEAYKAQLERQEAQRYITFEEPTKPKKK
jgi:YidC/Oxa1 family membrane protein insertase